MGFKVEQGGVWRTIGGRRIFIKDGSNLADAMRESGKFQKESNNYMVRRWTTKVNKNKTNELKPFKKQDVRLDKVQERGNLTKDEARECIKQAEEVFAEAEMHEKQISNDVINSAEAVNGKMWGLDFRLKQPESLAAKIGADAKEGQELAVKAEYGKGQSSDPSSYGVQRPAGLKSVHDALPVGSFGHFKKTQRHVIDEHRDDRDPLHRTRIYAEAFIDPRVHIPFPPLRAVHIPLRAVRLPIQSLRFPIRDRRFLLRSFLSLYRGAAAPPAPQRSRSARSVPHKCRPPLFCPV